MAEPVPGIDFANLPLPNEGILMTLFNHRPQGGEIP